MLDRKESGASRQPSENRIDGRSYPLEAHFVHADADGHLAVVAVMFENGAENSALELLWSQMPMHAEDRRGLTPAIRVDGLLPTGRDYFRFSGSLTTPPCTEGVAWHVLKTPLTVSKGQVEKFAQAVHGHNNHPVQPLNARTVLE